jgi:ABC-type siderophore export system fused ATPase/permease subunit
VYKSKTEPVHDFFDKHGLVCKINANSDKESVWESARPLLQSGDGAGLAITGHAVVAQAVQSAVGATTVDFGSTKLVFVLGGPGSGKGTLCDRLGEQQRSTIYFSFRPPSIML